MIGRGPNIHLLGELYSLTEKELEKKSNSELKKNYKKNKKRSTIDNIICAGGTLGGLGLLSLGGLIRDGFDLSWGQYIVEVGAYTMLVGGTYAWHYLLTDGYQRDWSCSQIKNILEKRGEENQLQN